MANYANLLATIAANIYTNNNNEVTAAMVKTAVDQMVDSLGAGYQFIDVATPATNPGTPDYKCFYIASTSGTYTNFGGLVVNDGEVALLKYDSAWSKVSTPLASLSITAGKVDIAFDNILDVAEIQDGAGFGNVGSVIVNAGWAGVFGIVYIPWRGQKKITINNVYCTGGFYAWDFNESKQPITGTGRLSLTGAVTFTRASDASYYLGVTLGPNGYLSNSPRASYGDSLTTDQRAPLAIRKYLDSALPSSKIVELFAYADGATADDSTHFYGWKNGKCSIQRAVESVAWTSRTIIHFSGHIYVTSTSQFMVGENGLWSIVFIPSTKQNIEIVGEGPERSSISVDLPDATVNKEYYEPLEVWGDNCAVKGLAIFGRNCRYCIHEDASARPNANNFTVTFEDLLLLHYVNAGGAGFNSCLGLGISDGMTLITRRCKFIQHDTATPSLYVHDGTNYKAGFTWIVDSCSLEHVGGRGYMLLAQALGSGVESTIVFEDNDPGFDFPFFLADYNLDLSVIRIKGRADYPVGYETRSSTSGVVLRITSKSSGASSSVRLNTSSTAFAAIFAGDFNSGYTDDAGVVHIDGYQYRDGVDVLHGWAQGEISLDAGTARSMQSRLGDCSGTNKVLGVTIDGTAYSVTFDKDYTNYTNAEILDEISAVIGAVADVELYNLGADYFPELQPSLTRRKNTGAEAILCGMGVNLAGGEMVKATTDAEVQGVAIEDVAPGYYGRVVRMAILSIFESDHHHVCLDAYPQTDADKYNYRRRFGIGSTPGVFEPKDDGVLYYEWLGYLNINIQ